MRYYKSLGFKYTGFIDNFLNDNPQYEAIAITYNSDDKLYHLLYKDSAQQPLDAVAFAEWIRVNEWKPASKEFGKWYRVKDGQLTRKTTTDLYALFSGSQASNQSGGPQTKK